MKRLIPIILCMCMLCACAKNTNSDTAVKKCIYIPVDAGKALCMYLPKVEVVESDNNVYWGFSDDVVLYVAMTHSTILEKQYKNTDVFYNGKSISRKISDTCAISMSGKKNTIDKYIIPLSRAKVVDVRLPYKVETLEKLPEFEMHDDMIITDNGLYMPDNFEFTSGINRAEIICDGSEYIESYVMDNKFEDIKTKLQTTVSCNAKGDVQVYDSGGTSNRIYYCRVGNHSIMCKALSMNQWIVYNCTDKFLDYALSGISVVSKEHK